MYTFSFHSALYEEAAAAVLKLVMGGRWMPDGLEGQNDDDGGIQTGRC